MTPADDVFAGGGETARLMARIDWAATDLGPIERWPQSLRAAVRIVLSSRYPMLLLWGPDLVQLYNDAYSGLIGDKHPAALGRDVRVTLAEGWDVLRPLIDEAMATGVASWVPALRLLLDRSGYREEAYFSVSHAPARDDDGVTVGVLTVCSEVTEQVVGERRLRLLHDLALPGGDGTAGVERTCARLGEVLGRHPLDVPFAAIYLRDGGALRRHALVGAAETDLPAHVALDASGDDPWGLCAAASGETIEVGDLGGRLTLTGGAFDDRVRGSVAQPLPGGVLVTGVSPSRALDDTYRSFLTLLAQQIGVAIRTAQAYQEERDRAAALVELDRVKTDFFTNVSHEFRTPLTLMLGPLADALADREEPLGAAQRDRVDTAWRSATRLLSLVNELLTFSSIESGRSGTQPHTLDLARYTRELAGVFRAAIERTGLRLTVDCPPLPGPVAVDPGHWERIVTNLLSNALKFTFVGGIRVTLESDATAIRLSVADTGIGIDAAELPRLFDRFHRIRGARSRSHEGTGIGLALVRELTRLSGGDVEVASAPGEGTTFTVVLPWSAVRPAGALPVEPAPEPFAAARAAAVETAGWLTDEAGDGDAAPAGGIRILVADDNSDMRAYLARLLTAEGWQVLTAADGEAALRAIRRDRPHLLITDVMMPRLDGFALVRKLRGDEATRGLPVVMLSARAGQESGVEGLAAGADDYVVKPFHAQELIARVRNLLEMASVRATHSRQMTALADTAAVIASGRALEEAFQTATDQARAMLGGLSAVTVLRGGRRRPELRFVAADGDDDDEGAPGESVEVEIKAHEGTVLGTITVRIDSANPPSEQARSILTPLADMLASLTQSSWQLEHEQQMTVTLQQAVLPESVPALDGWDVQTAYRPASGRVGGDWYDVAEAADGSLVVSIGDVAGHGLGAAVTTGQIRNAVRAYLVENPAPAHVIGRVATLVGRLHTPLFATLLVIRIDPRTGAFTWCSAGHPTPVVSAPGEPTTLLAGLIGPPLGLTRARYRQNTGSLRQGGQLLLFTDGLVEDFPKSIDEGLNRLCERSHREFVAGAPLTALVDAVLGDVPRPQHDDIAVVAIRRDPAAARTGVSLPELETTWTYPLGPGASAAARRDLQAALQGDAADQDLLYDLQVAATEAINNAVEHAQRPSRPEVHLRLRVTGGLVRIEVQDFGGWRARPPARDRGRGAILMNAYGDVRVTTTATGTLVTIERRWTAG
ncbi:SpoIIE family protein phosphatase [Actinoplanes sp. NPDC023936]|uniref:SpoIIE family protein phosphatase n=1 Tax=Actinoplanes sp. NPDC023936 TaxID=3154910 RepID=UPI0033EAA8A7